jgi:23S rRNA pseudouridine1911/1915/1917 synthase
MCCQGARSGSQARLGTLRGVDESAPRASSAEPQSLTVEPHESVLRLDLFLSRRLGISRAEVRRLLGAGRVRLDDRSVGLRHKGTILAGGARVVLGEFVPPEARRVLSEPETPLVLLDQGPGWLAVDKPAGAPVHPLREDETGSVLGAVVARYPEVQGVGEGGLRSGVVHRLDVATSGALLVATQQAAWHRLREGFRAHRAGKLYRAVVQGRPEERGELELRLMVARHRPARVSVAGAGARGARLTRLSWRRLEQLPSCALVEIRLQTGFLHQIRASFEHLGHPVLGDSRYGDMAGAAARLMLHAARLELDEVRVVSPDPPEFTAVLERLRGGVV